MINSWWWLKRFDNFQKVVKSRCWKDLTTFEKLSNLGAGKIWQFSKSCQIGAGKIWQLSKSCQISVRFRFDNFRKVVKSVLERF